MIRTKARIHLDHQLACLHSILCWLWIVIPDSRREKNLNPGIIYYRWEKWETTFLIGFGADQYHYCYWFLVDLMQCNKGYTMFIPVWINRIYVGWVYWQDVMMLENLKLLMKPIITSLMTHLSASLQCLLRNAMLCQHKAESGRTHL